MLEIGDSVCHIINNKTGVVGLIDENHTYPVFVEWEDGGSNWYRDEEVSLQLERVEGGEDCKEARQDLLKSIKGYFFQSIMDVPAFELFWWSGMALWWVCLITLVLVKVLC